MIVNRLYKNIAIFLLACSATISVNAQYFYIGGQAGAYTYTSTLQNSMGQRLMDYDFTFGIGGNLLLGYNFDDIHEIRVGMGYTPAGSRRIGGGLVFQNDMMYYSLSANYLFTPDWFVGSTHLYFGGGLSANIIGNVETQYEVNGVERTFLEYVEFNNPNNPNRDKIRKLVQQNDGNVPDENFFNPFDLRINAMIGIKSKLSDQLLIHAELITMFSMTDINHPDWRLSRRDGEYKSSRNLIGGLVIGFTYIL